VIPRAHMLEISSSNAVHRPHEVYHGTRMPCDQDAARSDVPNPSKESCSERYFGSSAPYTIHPNSRPCRAARSRE